MTAAGHADQSAGTRKWAPHPSREEEEGGEGGIMAFILILDWGVEGEAKVAFILFF